MRRSGGRWGTTRAAPSPPRWPPRDPAGGPRGPRARPCPPPLGGPAPVAPPPRARGVHRDLTGQASLDVAVPLGAISGLVTGLGVGIWSAGGGRLPPPRPPPPARWRARTPPRLSLLSIPAHPDDESSKG